MKYYFTIIFIQFIRMSIKSDKLKERLAEFVSKQSEEPSKKELEAALKTVFNEKKKGGKEVKDKSTVEKPKRKPTAYNLFYAEQSAILKEKENNKENEEGFEKMTAQMKMQYIGSLWKQKSGKDAETEPEIDDE